ncbi:unnamed protein product [Gongylonema pulchrum]|uniref:Vacuolar protein sorting-associated protein n=1 Tax=Gongylonema pulchrum TaxID=637853 RepID=A0A183EL29_9BILA|nr:unnamed protein product [Gongylonema pulchrum]
MALEYQSKPCIEGKSSKVAAEKENDGDTNSEEFDEMRSDKDEGGTLVLDKKLRDYLRRHRGASPVIVKNPSLAVVPYVAPLNFENMPMSVRINEIDAEEAQEYLSCEEGVVTFPDEATVEAMESTASDSEPLAASVLSISELRDSVSDETAMETDS